MKRTLVKIISAILALALFFSLGSCAFKGEEASPAEETILSDELVPGYVSTAIQVPDWLGGIRELTLEGAPCRPPERRKRSRRRDGRQQGL